MAQIIDGKAIAKQIREKLKEEVDLFKKETGVTPGLATILVGENPASQVYIRNKNRSTVELGMHSEHHQLVSTTSEQELLKLIHELNLNPKIHGILVQLPLPDQINAQGVLEAIHPAKDVDGFHPVNMGNLLIGRPGLKPCTPFGIMKLLETLPFEIKGKHAVVVGRSNIVGKPVALMLLARHATVTICHSRTTDLEGVIRHGDIVIAAVGLPEFIKGKWIKKGAVVIDVGINRLPDGHLVGDVEFTEAATNADFITPVPGGVGPMTIAMLMWNALDAAKNISKKC